VSGVILESPVVDWTATLTYQADTYRLPSPLRAGALAMIANPWGRPITGQKESIDFHHLDVLGWSSSLITPTLILHSDDDRFVPSGSSRELAALRPDLVTLVPFDTAGHTKLWNYDPERWTSAILGWLIDQNLAEEAE
jgi:pimeloyl-ACP methyl ester carboxylesterase